MLPRVWAWPEGIVSSSSSSLRFFQELSLKSTNVCVTLCKEAILVFGFNSHFWIMSSFMIEATNEQREIEVVTRDGMNRVKSKEGG